MTPKPKTAVQIIDRALELIATPKQWTKWVFAQDARGEVVDYLNLDATCFCLSGAVNRAIDEVHLPNEAWFSVRSSVLASVRNQIPNWDISAYNDRKITTHADILAVLTKARAELVGKELGQKS